MSARDEIRRLAKGHAERLRQKIDQRMADMESDDTGHTLIYQVLGIPDEEGQNIDRYQNKGRLLYRYAGSFLEDAARHCLKLSFPDSRPIRIPNPLGSRPKTFEIDCLIGNEALEIKWRDATTDGDHISKEHARIKAIAAAGYVPVRVMFYYPNRTQAIKVQEKMATLYEDAGGRYYFGEAAWAYIQERTEIDLKSILEELAEERQP